MQLQMTLILDQFIPPFCIFQILAQKLFTSSSALHSPSNCAWVW